MKDRGKARIGDLIGLSEADRDVLESYAREAFEEEDAVLARDLLSVLVRERPGRAYLWVGLGAARAELKDDKGAARAYARALKLDGDNIYALVNLGELYLGKRRDEEALALLAKAVKLDPEKQNPAAHRARALIVQTHRRTGA